MTVGSQVPELGQGRLKKDQYRSLHFSFVSYNKGNLVLSYFFISVFFSCNYDLIYHGLHDKGKVRNDVIIKQWI